MISPQPISARVSRIDTITCALPVSRISWRSEAIVNRSSTIPRLSALAICVSGSSRWTSLPGVKSEPISQPVSPAISTFSAREVRQGARLNSEALHE